MLNKLIIAFFGTFILTPISAIAGPMGMGGPPPTVVLSTITSADIIPAAEYVGHIEAIQAVDLVAQVTGTVQKIHAKEGSFVQENAPILTIEPELYQAKAAAARAAVSQAEAAKAGNQADLQVAKAGVEVAAANLDAAQANLVRATKFVARMRSANKRSITQTDLELAESDFLKAKAGVAEAKAIINQRQAQIGQTLARIAMDTANLKRAQADLQTAQINLGYTKIDAPIAGRIGQIKITKGNLVNPTSGPLARIVQVDPIRVVYSVSETDLSKVQKAVLNANSKSSRLLAPHLKMQDRTIYKSVGEVTFLDNEVDPATGTIAVRAEFANHDGVLVPGQYVTVQVKTAPSKVLPTVPQAAVLMSKEGSSVLMVNGKGIVTPRPIKIGPAINGMWAVLSGLKTGEKVIVSGLQKIRPGMPVTIAAAPGTGGKK